MLSRLIPYLIHPPIYHSLKEGIGNSISLPTTDLLFYSRFPNTEDVLWGDDLVIGDEYYIFGGWVLPANDSNIFAATGAAWYTDINTPKSLRDIEILALPNINISNIFFSVHRGLAVYKVTISAKTLLKVKKYYNIS